MADTVQKEERTTRYAEIFGGLLLVAFLVAIVFAGVAKMVPGMAPIAEKGAGLATPGDLLFYLLAAVTMVSAAGVAFSRNIIYTALFLLGTLLGTGALYVFLNADYLAITHSRITLSCGKIFSNTSTS